MGEHELAGLRLGLTHGEPAVDQRAARGFSGFVAAHHAGRFVAIQGRARSACRQLPRRLALPILVLSADFGDFGGAMAFGQRPERRAGLDRLELLGVADQHHLGAGLLGMGQHAVHLPRSNHASLVDHQHVARSQRVAAPGPAVLEAGDGSRGDPRSAFQPLGCDPRQGGAAHLVALRLPCHAGRAQHRALTGAGVADNEGDISRLGDMLEGVALRAPQSARATLAGG